MEKQSNVFKFLIVMFFIALTLVGIGVVFHFHGFVNEEDRPFKRNDNTGTTPNSAPSNQ